MIIDQPKLRRQLLKINLVPLYKHLHTFEMLRQMKQWTKTAKITFHYETLLQTMERVNNDDMQKWTNQE
jgi:hypothetical protein